MSDQKLVIDMKLLQESAFNVINEIKINDANLKDYYIVGPFLQSEVKNHNGRIYPRTIIEREANRYCKEKIETNRSNVGELGHPATPGINFDRVSHKIISLINER